MSSVLDITGRVAVVIGATSGIGRVLACGLAEAGAVVVPSGRRGEMVRGVCDEVRTFGGDTIEKTVDVGSRASIDAFRDAVVERFGRVDILVNAAGRTARKPTIEVTEEEWNGIIDTNLTGILRACQSFYEPLKASGRGRIVNIASLSSFVAFFEVAAYTASKAGVLALTRSLGTEWMRDGICVNAIAPGVFRTDLNAAMLDGTDRGRELLMRTPAGRFGRTEELVGTAIFLASDAAGFITGQSVTVDGGFLASAVNT